MLPLVLPTAMQTTDPPLAAADVDTRKSLQTMAYPPVHVLFAIFAMVVLETIIHGTSYRCILSFPNPSPAVLVAAYFTRMVGSFTFLTAEARRAVPNWERIVGPCDRHIMTVMVISASVCSAWIALAATGKVPMGIRIYLREEQCHSSELGVLACLGMIETVFWCGIALAGYYDWNAVRFERVPAQNESKEPLV